MDPAVNPPSKPASAAAPFGSVTKPTAKRRWSLGQLSAHVTGQGQGETYQLLGLLPGAVRGLVYAFSHGGNPTNLQIRYAKQVIFESGFVREARSGWLALPRGLANLVEVVLVTRGPCLDSQIDLRSLSPQSSGLTVADGVVLVGAGRQERAVLRIPVRLAAPAQDTVAVRWRTLAGTASDGRGGGDRADFAAASGVLIVRPGQQEQTIEITVFGDDPLKAKSDSTFEVFARDFAYSKDFQRAGTDPDQINGSTPYGDLGYRVDRAFQGPGGFQALGLTAREQFYVLISDPTQGQLSADDSEGERLLADLGASFGDNIDAMAYRQALEQVQELKASQTPWRFAKATIHDAGRAPVLAIRGTEPTRELADVWSDLNPRGIGNDQYLQNRTDLLAWLRQASRPEGLTATLAPHITGHSLGGALAQWLAADYATVGNLGDVVTFNAPGIGRAAATTDLSKVAAVRHYVTSTDIVSLAGEAFLPGRTVISDAPGSFRSQVPIAGPHLHPVIVPSLSGGGRRPEGLQQRITGTIDNPLFSYLPDPDYLLFLLAIARIPTVGPGLAAALTTRSGVERVRAQLGDALFQTYDRYRLGIATAEAVSQAAGSWSALAWSTVSQWPEEAWKAAGQWDARAWSATRLWHQEAWRATQHWSDRAWAATTHWSSAAWTASGRWGAQAWQAMVHWLNGPERQAPAENKPSLMMAAVSAYASAYTSAYDHATVSATTSSAPGAWEATSRWIDPVWTASGALQPESGDALLLGSPGGEQLQGHDGADILDGLGGDDHLVGGQGNDLLIAGTGSSHLEGGTGADSFLINTPGEGLVVIEDFDRNQGDRLLVNAGSLRLGSRAELAEDRLIYDSESGRLCLDPDGSGPEQACSLALLLNRPALEAGDITLWRQPIAPRLTQFSAELLPRERNASGREVRLAWDAFDPDSSALIRLRWSRPADQQSGVIAEGLPERDGSGSLVWNSAALQAGLYQLTAEIEDGEHDPIPLDQTLELTLPPQVGTPLRVSLSAPEASIAPGGWISVTLTADNPAPAPCNDASLLLELPAGVVLGGVEPTGTDPTGLGGGPGDAVMAVLADPGVSIVLGSLAAGERRSLRLRLQMPEGSAAPSHRIRAWAAADGGSPALSPLTSELTVRVDPPRQPDLVITGDQAPGAQGLNRSFDSLRTVVNRGTAAADNVMLTEVIPSGMLVKGVSGAEIHEIADGVMRFALGTLQPGEQRTVRLSLSSMVAGKLTALSEVSSSQADGDPLTNGASTTYTIQPSLPPAADLQLSLTASNRNPALGESLVLSATLTNQGPGDAAGPLVAIPCPEGLVLESVQAERGSYNPSDGLWDVGSLGLGASTTLRLLTRVRREGLWLAAAEVVDQADPDRDSLAGNGRPGEDDQAIVAIRAGSQPVTTVQVVEGPRAIASGGLEPIAIPLTYTRTGETPGTPRADGLELALHFDSRALDFAGLSQVISPPTQTVRIEDDQEDGDRNPATDKRVVLRWEEGTLNVPDIDGATPLVTASFRPTISFTDTLIGLSAGTPVAGRGFAGDPIAVQRTPWTLDIDGDGRIDNSSDGALLLRYAFGYGPGPDLIRHLIGTHARRRSAEAIGAYLQDGVRSGLLDLDGNGRFDALTDGLMVIRYNDGTFAGDRLTDGALASDATITSSSAIAAHLQRLTTLL